MAGKAPMSSESNGSTSLELTVRSYRHEDEPQVIHVWRTVFPDNPSWNVPVEDIRRKQAVQPDLFLVGQWESRLVATAMAGFDGHRGWLHLVAVLPEYRRRGIGRALLGEAERRLRAMGCPKINLQIRTSNDAVVRFYERLGYAVEHRTSMGKRLQDASSYWDDDSLLAAFEDTSFPLEAWTHRSHVRVAYLYLTQFDLEEAVGRMRTGLQAYIAAHGVEDGVDKGYHETITQAFMRLIRTAVTLYGPFADSEDFCCRHPELLEKRVLLLFYSKARILSPEAKRWFLEPDLTPLAVT